MKTLRSQIKEWAGHRLSDEVNHVAATEIGPESPEESGWSKRKMVPR